MGEESHFKFGMHMDRGMY